MSTNGRLSILILLAGLSTIASAQDRGQLGLLPVLNVNKKLTDIYELNFKIESRQITHQSKEFDPRHELIDFSAIVATRLGLSGTLGLGYLLRVRDGKMVNRFIQQFAMIRQRSSFRLAHRFASDQTFTEESATYRLRYRLSGQFPLNGQSVNPRELYLKVNNEYLNSLEEGIYDLEIRLAVFLGYEFNDRNKLELGLENRSDSIIARNLRHRIWINMGWYVSV